MSFSHGTSGAGTSKSVETTITKAPNGFTSLLEGATLMATSVQPLHMIEERSAGLS